jgi:hypothetical protein
VFSRRAGAVAATKRFAGFFPFLQGPSLILLRGFSFPQTFCSVRVILAGAAGYFKSAPK